MVEFSVIKANEAPKPKPGSERLSGRMREYESYVAALKKGEAGKLTLAHDESVRGVALRVSRAGKRLGRSVNTWAVDDVVYFSVS